MIGYNSILLSDLLEEYGENDVKKHLSSFSCPLNKDVEYFIHSKAIEFSKQSIARTHLIYTSYKDQMALIGYYTLANKEFCIRKKDISSNSYRRIKKFGNYDNVFNEVRVPAPLIAQLSKNFNNNYNTLISGDELLKLACDKVKSIQANIGGQLVYLECEDRSRLIEFYKNNGFYSFGKRNLEKSEKDKINGNYLIQMFKFLK